MKIQQTLPYNTTMGLNRVPTKRTYYLADCYWERDTINLKYYTVLITKNFMGGELASKLYYVTDKAGKWIKSKFKYIDDFGNKKVMRSYNNANRMD